MYMYSENIRAVHEVSNFRKESEFAVNVKIAKIPLRRQIVALTEKLDTIVTAQRSFDVDMEL